MGDKVIIPQIPDMTISDYTVGATLTYEVPAMTTLELLIDKAKAFLGFAISDARPSRSTTRWTCSLTMSEQMRTRIDSTLHLQHLLPGARLNRGANAGVKTGAYTTWARTRRRWRSPAPTCCRRC